MKHRKYLIIIFLFTLALMVVYFGTTYAKYVYKVIHLENFRKILSYFFNFNIFFFLLTQDLFNKFLKLKNINNICIYILKSNYRTFLIHNFLQIINQRFSYESLNASFDAAEFLLRIDRHKSFHCIFMGRVINLIHSLANSRDIRTMSSGDPFHPGGHLEKNSEEIDQRNYLIYTFYDQ